MEVTQSAGPRDRRRAVIGTSRRGARVSRRTALVTVVGGALMIGLSLLRWVQPGIHAYPDTTWYVRDALLVRGWDQVDADREAALVRCTYSTRPALAPEARADCLVAAQELLRYPPRYEEIFAARPGYPLLVAPFSAALGRSGVGVATLAVAAADGILVMMLVRLLGGSLAGQLFAGGVFLLLPSGFWSTRLLSEGTMLTGLLVTLCGVVLLQRGSRRAGVTLFLAGFGIAFLTKSANATVLALALLASGLTVGISRPGDQNGRRLAALSGAVLLTTTVAITLLGWPGLETSVQDMATDHFHRPDVPDVWIALAQVNIEFWPKLFVDWLHDPVPVLGCVAACAWLAIRLRALSIPLLLAGLSCVLLLVAHPVASEWDRLLVPIWIPVALTAGLASDALSSMKIALGPGRLQVRRP